MKYYDKNDLEVINETKKRYLPEKLAKCDDDMIITPNVCVLNKIFTEWNKESGLPIEYVYIHKSPYPNFYEIEIRLKYEEPITGPRCYASEEFFAHIVATLFRYNKTNISNKFNKALKKYFSYITGDSYEDTADFEYQIREKYKTNSPAVGNIYNFPIDHIEAVELTRAFKHSYDKQCRMYQSMSSYHYNTYFSLNNILDYITIKFLNEYNTVLSNNEFGKDYFDISNIESKWEEMTIDPNHPYNGLWRVNLNYIKGHNAYIPLICDGPFNIANQLINFSMLYGMNIIGLDSMDSEMERRLVVNILSGIYPLDKKYIKNEQYQGTTKWDKTMEEIEKENNE